MPHLILFDIDGTLLLTGGAGSRALTRALHEVFRVKDGFRGVAFAGRTDPGIVNEALSRAGVTADARQFARFRDRYAELLREEIHQPGPRKGVLPGVRALLDALHRRPDAFLGLLTGNYTDSARIKLDYFGLWRYFACGAYGEEAADRNGLVPVAIERARTCGWPGDGADRVVVVGDTPLDVACARASGAVAVAVATGGHSTQDLADSGADVVFEDLSDPTRFVELLEAGFPGVMR